MIMFFKQIDPKVDFIAMERGLIDFWYQKWILKKNFVINNNSMIWSFLKVCQEKGWLYKGHDTVPWCPRCGTAISQHEISTEEYKEVSHRTVVFKLPIKGKSKEYLLAWTTTPWTIPGNVALAVDPEI